MSICYPYILHDNCSLFGSIYIYPCRTGRCLPGTVREPKIFAENNDPIYFATSGVLTGEYWSVVSILSMFLLYTHCAHSPLPLISV